MVVVAADTSVVRNIVAEVSRIVGSNAAAELGQDKLLGCTLG